MAFAEDFAEFFDTADGFAVDAIWSLNGQSVQAIFDKPYDNVLNISSSQPQALLRDDQTQGLAAGQTLTINGAVWKIAELQPNGLGLTLVLLNEV